MDCRGAREAISAYVDGETAPEETARIREHLAACPECRALEARMRALGDGVLRLRCEPSEGFRDAVFARLDAENALPRKAGRLARPWHWAAVPLAAAAAVVLFLVASREPVLERIATAPDAPRVETQGTARIEPPATARVEAPTPRRDTPESAVPDAVPEKTASAAPGLSAEEMEMIALLDVLSGEAFEAGEDPEPLELLAPEEGA
ncbi:MAG: anti-sigma factor [Thermodesulfobacteriota bacterium]